MTQRKLGVILSYISQFVKILSGLIYTPVMLRILGSNEYGLYQLVSSTVAYLSLLSLGFTTAYVRFYTKAGRLGEEEVKKVNGMFMIIFLFMSFLCFICGGFLILNAEHFFGGNLTASEYAEAKVLLAILTAAMAVSFPCSVFSCNITANEKFIFERAVDLLQNLLNPFICLPLLLLGYGNIAICSVSLCLAVAKLFISGNYCIKKLGMKFCFDTFDKSLFKEMSVFTFFIFINQIIDQINWNVDKYLLGRFAGLMAVAVYGVGGQINSLYISFSNNVSSVFTPLINMLAVEKENTNQLNALFIKVGRIQYMVIALIWSEFFLFGKRFVCLWAGRKYLDSYTVAMLLMTPMIVPLIQNIGIEIQRAKNKHQVRTCVYAGVAIINVLISIPFIKWFGPSGAALGTTISLITGNILFMNFYYYFELGINVVEFWKNIFVLSIPIVLLDAAAYLAAFFISADGWGAFLIMAFLFMGLYFMILWFWGMNSYEKDMVVRIFRKMKVRV